MSGRRLRHVNAEKRLEEWKAEEEERKLEKMADDYLKKMVKKGKGGKKEQGAEKYVEKYREDSKRCVEEVDRSVRESMGELMSAGNKKRKLLEKLKDADAKRAKIWIGKRKVGESDSDDSDDDAKSDDSDAENEKSVVTENGNQSDSSKDASSASVSALASDGDNHSGGSSESGSEEEKDMIAEGTTEFAAKPSGCNEQVNGSGTQETSSGEKMSASEEVVSTSAKTVVEQGPVEPHLGSTAVTDQLPGTSTLVELDGLELNGASECKGVSPDEGNSGGLNAVEAPLNFDDFNSAAEMEVLGLERLKSELQTRGLKCGGTLQERAARLFLLKTTPLEKLPKKLLAKK
uniref:Sde2 N-terminal ubiquitin domain-containing protein n=2 Tax=Chenopodium quinoa TaxID=63459 RepID=A0A803M4U5_CHEQI